jgi:hypothetical protein
VSFVWRSLLQAGNNARKISFLEQFPKNKNKTSSALAAAGLLPAGGIIIS